MVNPTSQDLSLEKLHAGDRAEFARLVDAFSGPIYRLGIRMLGNAQDAEDILQNTFLNALTHLSEFEGRSQPRHLVISHRCQRSADADPAQEAGSEYRRYAG